MEAKGEVKHYVIYRIVMKLQGVVQRAERFGSGTTQPEGGG